eukprot:gene9402-biopygen6733
MSINAPVGKNYFRPPTDKLAHTPQFEYWSGTWVDSPQYVAAPGGKEVRSPTFKNYWSPVHKDAPSTKWDRQPLRGSSPPPTIQSRLSLHTTLTSVLSELPVRLG